MDDFVISNLQESKNEWCSRLVSIFTPLVIEGIRSIFNESWKICLDNNEITKYLMTFQNLLCRVPKWNSIIIEEERNRIIERSGCGYLEDLITCVHIIQLKVLTCIRVGNKQKKIDISIPKLDHFIHKVYIHVARKIYTNVYLFEKGQNISPLQTQKHNRELEVIVQECIMMAIRDSIPTEAIIKAYMDESVEHEEEVFIENVEDPILKDSEEGEEISREEFKEKENTKEEESLAQSAEKVLEREPPTSVPSIQNINEDAVVTKLSFNDIDSVLEMDTNEKTEVVAPKTLDRLEEISVSRALQRKLEEEEEEDEDRIRIHKEDDVSLNFDVFDLNPSEPKQELSISDSLALLDIEELA